MATLTYGQLRKQIAELRKALEDFDLVLKEVAAVPDEKVVDDAVITKLVTRWNTWRKNVGIVEAPLGPPPEAVWTCRT